MSRSTHAGPRSGPRLWWARFQTYAKCCPASSNRAQTRSHTHTLTLSRGHIESVWVAVPYVCGCFGLLPWGRTSGVHWKAGWWCKSPLQAECVFIHTCPEVRGGRKSKSLAFCCWSGSGGGVLVPRLWAEGVLHPHTCAAPGWEWRDFHLSKCNKVLFSSNFMVPPSVLILLVILVFMLCFWGRIVVEWVVFQRWRLNHSSFTFFSQPLKSQNYFCFSF